jgi:hypothetical protein
MYSTTQCDWTASSYLQKYITPAVVKGQKEYHQDITRKMRAWIASHPEDFGVVHGIEDIPPTPSSPSSTDQPSTQVTKPGDTPQGTEQRGEEEGVERSSAEDIGVTFQEQGVVAGLEKIGNEVVETSKDAVHSAREVSDGPFVLGMFGLVSIICLGLCYEAWTGPSLVE